jgi:hypothetical protein
VGIGVPWRSLPQREALLIIHRRYLPLLDFKKLEAEDFEA